MTEVGGAYELAFSAIACHSPMAAFRRGIGDQGSLTQLLGCAVARRLSIDGQKVAQAPKHLSAAPIDN